jgi:hypothetical protein
MKQTLSRERANLRGDHPIEIPYIRSDRPPADCFATLAMTQCPIKACLKRYFPGHKPATSGQRKYAVAPWLYARMQCRGVYLIHFSSAAMNFSA